MLKEVQTWGIFLQKLGLPDKKDITMYSRPLLRYCHCLNLILSAQEFVLKNALMKSTQ
jgi:hypothetical protein